MISRRVATLSLIAILNYSAVVATLHGDPIAHTYRLGARFGADLSQNIVTTAPLKIDQTDPITGFIDKKTFETILIASVASGLGLVMLDPARRRNQVGLVVAFGSYGLLSLIRNLK